MVRQQFGEWSLELPEGLRMISTPDGDYTSGFALRLKLANEVIYPSMLTISRSSNCDSVPAPFSGADSRELRTVDGKTIRYVKKDHFRRQTFSPIVAFAWQGHGRKCLQLEIEASGVSHPYSLEDNSEFANVVTAIAASVR